VHDQPDGRNRQKDLDTVPSLSDSFQTFNMRRQVLIILMKI